jgi:hypothetical protein
MRLDGNAGDTVIFLLEAKPVSRTQLLERRPGLAIPADELAIIRADRANRGRRGGFRELRAASDADEAGHRFGLRRVASSEQRAVSSAHVGDSSFTFFCLVIRHCAHSFLFAIRYSPS